MSIGSVPLTDLAPLAVMLPVLGAAVTFMLVRRPRAQITVTVSALVLTLVLDALLLAAVWDTGIAAVHLARSDRVGLVEARRSGARPRQREEACGIVV